MKRLLETVLIVEDHDDSRLLLEDVLSQAGFRTLPAASGAEALRILAEEVPDIIVLDLMLPWVNGVEVLATIRGMPALVKVPVLVVTATQTTAFDLRAYRPLALMRKPLDLGKIVPTLQRMLVHAD
jgi:CheY-like chemotaxis protein